MSSEIQPVPQSGSVTESQSVPQDPTLVDPTTSTITGATTISSLNDLKEKAKPVYDAITMAIALRLRQDQERSIKRFKEEQRKMRQ